MEVSLIDYKYHLMELLESNEGVDFYKACPIDQPNSYYCLKLIQNKENDSRFAHHMRDYLRTEFSILKSIDHKNIVKVFDFGYDKEKNAYYFIEELLEGDNLFDFIKKNNSKDGFTKQIYDILVVLNYLHSENIIHYNITPHNIFVIKNSKGLYEIKIRNFILAEINRLHKKTKLNSHSFFTAPELYAKEGIHTNKVDLYSLGMTLLYCFLSKDYPDQKQSMNNRNTSVKFLINDLKNPKLKLFLEVLTEPNPELRISSATNCISKLNLIFKTKYSLTGLRSEMPFLQNSAFLIHNKITTQIEEYATQKENPSYSILLCGDGGSGKTKIINQLEFTFSYMMKEYLIINPDSKSNEKKFYNILSFLEQLMFLSRGSVNIEMNEFYDLYSQLSKKNNGDNFYINLFPKILELVKNLTNDKRYFIILENYQLLDSLSQMFVKYLIANKHEINIVFVLTATDKYLKDFYQQEKDGKIEVIQIPALNGNNLNIILKFFLGEVSQIPDAFYENIIKVTKGNFKKIMILLEHLIENKVLQKISDKYYFQNTVIFDKILNQNSSNLYNETIALLTPVSLEIIKILSLSFEPLDISFISSVLKINPQLIMKSFHYLTKTGYIKLAIISERYLLNIFTYFISNMEFTFSVINTMKTDEILYYLDVLSKYNTLSTSPIDKKFNKITKEIYKYFVDSNKEANIIINYIENLKTLENLKKIFFISKNLSVSQEIIFVIKIHLAQIYYDNKQYEEFEDIFSQLSFSLDEKSIYYHKFLVLQLNYLMRKEKFMEAIDFLLVPKFDYFKKSMSKDQFYEFYFNALFLISKNISLEDYLVITDKLYLDFIDISNDDNNCKLYLDILKSENKKEDFVNIEDSLYKNLENLKHNNCFYEIILKYNLIIEEDTDRKVRDNKWKQIIKESIIFSKLDKEFGYFISLNTILARFYYYSSQFSKALKIYNLVYKYNQMLGQNKPLVIYKSLPILKFALNKPMPEVVSLELQAIDIMFKRKLKKELAILYYNVSIFYYQQGYINEASKKILQALDYYKFAKKTVNLLNLKNLLKFNLKLNGIGKIKSKIDELDLDIDQSREIKYFIDDTIKNIMNQKDYDNDELSNIEIFDNSAPGVIINYLKKHKKLPEKKFIYGERKIDETIFSQKVVKYAVDFMLSPEEKILLKLHISLKKLYVLGYIYDCFEILTPFMEYMYVFKPYKEHFHLFIDLYKNIMDIFNDNMKANQKEIVYSQYIFKRSKKILDRIIKL